MWRGMTGANAWIPVFTGMTRGCGRDGGAWREWRGVARMAGCGGNDGVWWESTSFPRNAPVIPPYDPPVIPVKTGIHASNPAHGAGMPVIPPVIPVKTGIHASNPARGAETPVIPPSSFP